MPYTNDMQSLAQIVSPVDAAMQSGQQEGNANLQEALKTRIQQATMPQEIQKASLQNALLQAQGQNEQGVAAQNQAAGLTAMQAQPSASQAAIAGNQLKLNTDQLENMNNLGAMVGQVAQYMQNVPGPARPAMMQQFLDQHNVTDPGIRQAVASGDPELLQRISQGLFATSQQARMTTLQEGLKGQTARDVATTQSEGRVTAAELAAGAREQAARIAANVKQVLAGPEQMYAQLTQRIGTPQEQPGDRARATDLRNTIIQLRQFGAQTTRELVMGPGSGIVQGSSDFNGYGTAPPAPATQAPPQNALIEEARKRGLMK